MKTTRRVLYSALAFAAIVGVLVLTGCTNGNDETPATEYTITMTDDGNGTAVAKVGGTVVTEAEEGVTVTLTATPNTEYKFLKWTVVSGDITLLSEEDNPATFTMPAGDVEIKAEFRTIEYDVYIAGGYEVSSEYFACYWKNEERITLESDGESYSNSIAVYDGHVYIAGACYDSDKEAFIACYWKDGQRTNLETDSESYSYSITVSDGSVYVSGYYAGDTEKGDCYWKDGQRTIIEPNHYSEGSSIAVSGSNVYVGGAYYDNTENSYVACYWKDGQRTSLEIDNGDSFGISAAVSDGSIYVAGYRMAGTNIACYWKDGMRTDLETNKSSRGESILIDGGSVYVAGVYNDLRISACYWKDGERTDLETNKASSGDSIAIAGGSVYIAGRYWEDGGQVACYWKDGERRNLEAADYESVAVSVAVVAI